jgi:hypothetical protein
VDLVLEAFKPGIGPFFSYGSLPLMEKDGEMESLNYSMVGTKVAQKAVVGGDQQLQRCGIEEDLERVVHKLGSIDGYGGDEHQSGGEMRFE